MVPNGTYQRVTIETATAQPTLNDVRSASARATLSQSADVARKIVFIPVDRGSIPTLRTIEAQGPSCPLRGPDCGVL